MKLTLTIFGLLCVRCIASEVAVKESQPQKRSIGEEFLGLSPLTDTSISSHTHTTTIVEKPVPVPISISSPTISTTKIISPATTIHSTLLPTSYTTYGSSYPYYSSFGKYPYYSSIAKYPYYSGLGFSKYYSTGLRKYYSGYYPTTFSKSYYTSSPVWSYKW